MLITERKLRQIIYNVLLENNSNAVESLDDFKSKLNSAKNASFSLPQDPDEIKEPKGLDSLFNEKEVANPHPNNKIFAYNSVSDLFPNLTINIKVKSFYSADESQIDFTDTTDTGGTEDYTETTLEWNRNYTKGRAEKILSVFFKKIASYFLNNRVMNYLEKEFSRDGQDFIKKLNEFLNEFSGIDFIGGDHEERTKYLGPFYMPADSVAKQGIGNADGALIVLPIVKKDSDKVLGEIIFHEFLHHVQYYFTELSEVSQKRSDWVTSDGAYTKLNVKANKDHTEKLLAHILTDEEYDKIFNQFDPQPNPFIKKNFDMFDLDDLLSYKREDRDSLGEIFEYITMYATQNLEHMYNSSHLALSIRTIYQFADDNIAAENASKDRYYKFFKSLLSLNLPNNYYRVNYEVSRAIAPLLHNPEYNAKALVTYYGLAKSDSKKQKDTVTV